MLKGYIKKLNENEFYMYFECWGYGQMSVVEALEYEGADIKKDAENLKIGETKYYNF